MGIVNLIVQILLLFAYVLFAAPMVLELKSLPAIPPGFFPLIAQIFNVFVSYKILKKNRQSCFMVLLTIAPVGIIFGGNDRDSAIGFWYLFLLPAVLFGYSLSIFLWSILKNRNIR